MGASNHRRRARPACVGKARKEPSQVEARRRSPCSARRRCTGRVSEEAKMKIHRFHNAVIMVIALVGGTEGCVTLRGGQLEQLGPTTLNKPIGGGISVEVEWRTRGDPSVGGLPKLADAVVSELNNSKMFSEV